MDNISGSVKGWLEEKEKPILIEQEETLSNDLLKRAINTLHAKNQELIDNVEEVYKHSKKKELYDILVSMKRNHQISKNLILDLEN